MENFPIDLSGATLVSDRLILRPFQQTDLDDFYEYAKVPGVGEAAGWNHHLNIQESQVILNLFINEKKTFAIVKKDTGKVIGSLGLEKCGFPETYYPRLTVREIGYVLSKDYWGNGFMSEAVDRVIGYCFNELGIDALAVCHFKGNERSRRVIEKAGFSYLFTNTYITRNNQFIKENLCYLLLNSSKLKRNK